DQPGDRLQAGVRVGADVQAPGLGDQLGAHVVGEAPGPDRPPADAGRGPAHPHGPDDRLAAGGDLDAGRLDRARPRLGGRGVNRADRAAPGPPSAPPPGPCPAGPSPETAAACPGGPEGEAVTAAWEPMSISPASWSSARLMGGRPPSSTRPDRNSTPLNARA